MKRSTVTYTVFFFLSLSACGSTTPTPSGDTTTPPGDTIATGDTTTPPGDTIATGDTTTPPEDSAAPSDNTTPPEDSAAPSDTTTPPEDSATPSDTTAPPEDTTEPPMDDVVPPLDLPGPPDDGGPVLQGECGGPDDQLVFESVSFDTAMDAVKDCAVASAGDCSTIGGCLGALPGVSDLSQGCTDCFVGLGCCVVTQCPACLTDTEGAACDSCMDTASCFQEFSSCVGLPGGLEEEGACYNPADLPLMMAGGEAAPSCAAQFSGELAAGNCTGAIAQCISESSGLSEECGDCLGIRMCCVAENCPICSEDPNGDACGMCQFESGCQEEFEFCAGFVVPPPMPMDGACSNEADGENMMLAFSLAPTCEMSNETSILAGDCSSVSLCLQNELGLGAECSDCFAALPCCLNSACPVCTTDQESDACMQCKQTSGCDIEFDMCIGLPPMP